MWQSAVYRLQECEFDMRVQAVGVSNFRADRMRKAHSILQVCSHWGVRTQARL